LVAVPPGGNIVVIDDENFVGNIEDDVALAGGPFEMQLHRVELEGEIVAEGTVEAEIAVVFGAVKVGDRAQHGEDGGRTGALFLGQDGVGLGNPEIHPRVGTGGDGDDRQCLDGGGDGRKHDFAATVQRLDRHGAATRGDDDGRVDDRRVPACIAAGIFVVRREHGPTARVERIDASIDGT